MEIAEQQNGKKTKTPKPSLKQKGAVLGRGEIGALFYILLQCLFLWGEKKEIWI